MGQESEVCQDAMRRVQPAAEWRECPQRVGCAEGITAGGSKARYGGYGGYLGGDAGVGFGGYKSEKPKGLGGCMIQVLI